MPAPPTRPAPNLKQLLLTRSDWFAREIMKGVKRSEYAFLTEAQSHLLATMAGKPTSMAELARRLAISRQAVHKTVAELARRGILEIQDDPERGNAKRIVYTERGRQVNRAGAAIIERLEERIAERIGSEKLQALKRILAEDWD